MNFHSKKMAAIATLEPSPAAPPSRPASRQAQPKHVPPDAPLSISTDKVALHPKSSAPSKRPASGRMEPTHLLPGVPILGNEGGQAVGTMEPMIAPLGRSLPAAVPGDETSVTPQPNGDVSRRIPPRKGRSQAKPQPKPSVGAPDCNNPAKAGGIDHASSGTHGERVDAKNPGSTGRDAAIRLLSPKEGTQRHDSISPDQGEGETQSNAVWAGDQRAHSPSETQIGASPLIAEITQLVRMRRRWHKAEKSLTLQGKALCRSWTNGDKDEANAAYDRAADGKPDDPMLAMALAPFLDAKARFETERGAIEKTLRKLARTLPVWKAWAEGVKGLGDLRLAVIVGECGDIGAYRNPSCFWKRMGLAVIGGQRQRRVTDAAEALEHGYNPERRAIAYVMSTELIKAQVRRIKDEPETALRPAKRRAEPSSMPPDAPPSVAIGPYGQVYLDRKAYEAGREGITKAHANNRAGRYLAKRVLRDLYAAWRAAA